VTDTLTIPQSSEELAEMLNDSGRMKAVFADKEKFKEFITAYARKVAPIDGEIANQVREQTQLALAEMLRGDGKGRGSLPPVDLTGNDPSSMSPLPAGMQSKVSRGKGAAYNKASTGARLEREAKDEGFSSIGELCAAIRARHDGAHPRYDELMAKMNKVRGLMNSFGSEVPADGGFLIPEVQRAQLLQLALEDAIVRPRATVIPMSTLKTSIPSVDETSHVTTLFGGVQFFWTEEGAQLTESQAAFGKVTLDAKKLTGFFKTPNELLADAIAFSAWFDTRIPAGLAWAEDIAFMTSTGVGEPMGFVNCDAAVVQTAEAGQPTATLVWENITKMYARMLPSSLNNAVWLAAIDTFPQLATMALSVGTGGAPVWLSNGAQGPPMTILGRPVYFTEKMPALGTTGDLSFVDLSYYLIGDRQMAQVSSSEHFAFQNDQTAFRIIERVDGRPWLQSALTPHNNSANTLSAFVQLASR
jgi:HK97 family phage major capsid protein